MFAFWGTLNRHRSGPPAFPSPEQDSLSILFFRLHLDLPGLSFPKVFLPKHCIRLPLSHTCYVLRPSHSPRSIHPTDVYWWVLITKLIIMHFSPVSRYFLRLRPEHLPQHHTFKHVHTSCDLPSFTPTWNNKKKTVLCNFFFIFWGSQWEDERFRMEL
jgi:hypothetical protein